MGITIAFILSLLGGLGYMFAKVFRIGQQSGKDSSAQEAVKGYEDIAQRVGDAQDAANRIDVAPPDELRNDDGFKRG